MAAGFANNAGTGPFHTFRATESVLAPPDRKSA
jgi:hypothetical protein